MSGIRSGVNGTPTFYVNGIRHDDSWDEKTLLPAITQTLADSERSQPREKKTALNSLIFLSLCIVLTSNMIDKNSCGRTQGAKLEDRIVNQRPLLITVADESSISCTLFQN